MPSYDLIPLISPHLDLHMIFPLLEFQESCILNNSASNNSSPTYSSASLVAARLALIRNTHMVDYAIEIHHEVHQNSSGEEEVPKEFEEWRQNVYGELNRLREGAAKCDELFRNDELKVSSSFFYGLSDAAFQGVVIWCRCAHKYYVLLIFFDEWGYGGFCCCLPDSIPVIVLEVDHMLLSHYGILFGQDVVFIVHLIKYIFISMFILFSSN